MSCLYSFSSIPLLSFSFESYKIGPSPSQFHSLWNPPNSFYFAKFSVSNLLVTYQVNVSFLFETFSFLSFQDKKISWFSSCLTSSFFLCNLRNLYYSWIPHHLPKLLDLECLCSVVVLFSFLYTIPLESSSSFIALGQWLTNLQSRSHPWISGSLSQLLTCCL